MNTEIDTVLSDVRSLAQEHHWASVIALADRVHSNSDSDQILISAPTDINTLSVQRWMREIVPGIKITTLALSELFLDPLPVVTAEKVVAIFECGRFIEADAVATISSTFFSRPLHSYAIVMSQAERIETEDDLDLIERSIQRLLLSNLVSTWNKQDLLAYGVYLWSDTSPVDWLQFRVQRDKDALATWLHKPTPATSSLANELATYRALCLIDLAENELNQEERTRIPTSSTVDQPHAIYNTRQSISSLKIQLLRRVDTSATSVERTILTSLQTLQEDLLENLDSSVLQPLEGTSLSEEQFRQVIADYITRGVRGWQSKSNQLLTSTMTTTINDVELFVRGIDWPLVNQIVAKYGKASTYPDTLLEPLLHKEVGAIPSVGLKQDGERTELGAEDNQLTFLLNVAAGTGIGSAVGFFLGFGVIGAVAGGMLGGIGTGIYVQRRQSNQKMGQYKQYARKAIQQVIREANLLVQERIQEGRQTLRKILGAELSALEILLDQALQENSQLVQVGTSFTATRVRLQEYRHRLSAAANT